jgi:Aerobic-type carbon monoxide dehydrogenase, large subunit CoxL/CutL homologs
MTTACDEDGRLTAMKAIIVSDTGAYASLGGPSFRGPAPSGRALQLSDIDITGTAVYTNNPPSRGIQGVRCYSELFCD